MNKTKIEWLEAVVKGMEILSKQEKPGMTKKKLVSVTVHLNVILKEFQDEEKKIKASR